MKRITIKDIAKLAEVSPAAVSLAINGKRGLSDETRAKVLDVVNAHNYVPNPNSKRLLSHCTGNIAILLRQGSNTLEELFYTELNRSILQECESNSYNMVFTVYTLTDGKVKLPNIILAHDVDGVIIYGDCDERLASAVEQYDLPLVTLDSARPYDGRLSVRVDYSELSYIATRHLIEYGHKNIAYIGNSESHHFNNMTFNGFKRAVTEAEISISLEYLQIEAFNGEQAAICVEKLLSSRICPTAIFCSTDFIALTAIRKLVSAGVRVPEDISVIGVDDVLPSQLFVPALTTVHVDREKIGHIGMELLLRKLRGEPVESVTIPTGSLILRESTRRL